MQIDIPWWTGLVPLAIALTYLAAGVFIVIWSLRGTKPSERAEILRALGEILRRPPKPPANPSLRM